MNTLAEIEAVLPTLSPEELARVEAVLHRLRHERDADARFDGRPWPSNSREVKAILTELDALPPLLAPDEAEKFDAWRVALSDPTMLQAIWSSQLQVIFSPP